MTDKQLKEASVQPNEVIQSYLLTIGKREKSIVAERILMKLVELAQTDIKGVDFHRGEGMRAMEPSLDYPGVTRAPDGSVWVVIPIRDLLPNADSTNYRQVREGFEHLQKQVIKWETPKVDREGNLVYDKKTGKLVVDWSQVNLISESHGDSTGSGVIRARINPIIWSVMEDFTKGFRAYDLKVAMRIRKPIALRLYQLMSRQKTPLSFHIDDLKERWGIEKDKYDRATNFISKVIEPAKAELDSASVRSPYSFEYEVIREKDSAKRGRSPIVGITFFPVYRIENDTPLSGNIGSELLLNENVKKILVVSYHFTELQMNMNHKILYTAQITMKGTDESHPTLFGFLNDPELKNNAVTADNMQSYVIGSVKRHLKEVYGIDVKSKRELLSEKKVESAMRKAEQRRMQREDEVGSIGDLFGEF